MLPITLVGAENTWPALVGFSQQYRKFYYAFSTLRNIAAHRPRFAGQRIKQLSIAHAREIMPALMAPKNLDVLAQAAAIRLYVSLYETQCCYRSVSHMQHRHALVLMCQGASPMGAMV